MKPLLMILGILSALLIVAQLVMGQLIANGNPRLVKSHQHTGYLTVVIALTYIVLSLPKIASLPKRSS